LNVRGKKGLGGFSRGNLIAEQNQMMRNGGAKTDRLATTMIGGGWPTVLLFAALLLFYGLTAAHNLTETDDVYAFAHRAETRTLTDINDPRLLLFHIGMRLLYLAANSLSESIPALLIMRTVSAVSAALSLILLARLLTRFFGLSATTGVISISMLGVFYGFWRYAAEAEVYVPSMFLIILTIYLVLAADRRPEARCIGVLPAALLAGLAVLFYQPNAIPLFFALPIYFLRRERLAWLFAYIALGGTVVVLGYLAAYLASQAELLTTTSLVAFLKQRSAEFHPSSPSLALAVKSLVALSHNVLSANWVFGFKPLVDVIREVFSSKVIDEEVYAASRVGFFTFFPLVTLPAFTTALLFTARTAFLKRRQCCSDRRVILCLVWCGLYAAVIARLDATSLEAWIMVLLPLTILLAVFLVEPCIRSGKTVAVLATLAALFLHNATGGMGIVHSADGDYDRARAAWVIDNATAADLVILTSRPKFAEFIRYVSQARAVNILPQDAPLLAAALLDGSWRSTSIFTIGRDYGGQSMAAILQDTGRRKGRVLVYEEFLRPPYGLLRHSPKQIALALKQTAAIRHRVTSVARNEVGEVFLVPFKASAVRDGGEV
jgi:hypothetical protein